MWAVRSPPITRLIRFVHRDMVSSVPPKRLLIDQFHKTLDSAV